MSVAAPTSLPILERGPGAGLPLRVTSHMSGGRDRWTDALSKDPADPHQAVLDCLREVLDPEIPISLVDLGLIYGVRVEDRRVSVDITFTATACPCMEFIREDVSDRLLQERWIDEVALVEVWDPPWTTEMITPEGRARLRQLGVGG